VKLLGLEENGLDVGPDWTDRPTNQPTNKLTKGEVLRRALGIVPC